MMKRIYPKVIIGAILVCFVGCKDFLQVKPTDKIYEGQLYESKTGIHSIINGIYMQIAEPSLYGQNMTMGAVDIMAQYYDVTSAGNNYAEARLALANYNYDQETSEDVMESIWQNAYKSILNCNKFINNIKKHPDVISEKEADILQGEALGIRAMLHFDMLRLFGPVYKNNPTGDGIPYYTEVTNEAQPILTTDEVIKKIKSDLKQAKKLLEDDPVRSEGVSIVSSFDQQYEGATIGYFDYNNHRMNYYAVMALQARVYLYAGEDEDAYQAATTLIDEASEWFPWAEVSSIFQSNDRVFSSGIIFGVENHNMYDQQMHLFEDRGGGIAITPVDDRIDGAFGGVYDNANDYRLRAWWKYVAVKNMRTFDKYEEPSASAEWRFFQPVIRMPEIYLIAAETAPSKQEAIDDYLNELRFHRGLPDVSQSANLDEKIEEAYRREFWGEGQMFFYYKRNAISDIPNGNRPFGAISMGADEYIVPLPYSEVQYR